MKTFTIFPTSILLILVLISNGCSSLMTATSITAAKFPWSSEDKPKTPTKLTAVWTHTVLNQMGKRGVRGFGGRLMFYKKKSKESVKIEGTLTIYAFDEERKHHTNNPDRKFVFLPEQMEDHYSKSDIGHSYSIWVPWDEVGGEQKQITLITRFEPKEGAGIMTESTRKLLPGFKKKTDNDRTSNHGSHDILKNSKSGVELISHEEEAEPVEKSSRKKQAEPFSIDLPGNYLRNHPQNFSNESALKQQQTIQQNRRQQNNHARADYHNQNDLKRNAQNSSQNLSDHFEQSVHSLQNQLQAQKRQDNQPSASHAPSKRFHGWSPEPRPSVTQRFRTWQEQNSENPGQKLQQTNQNWSNDSISN